MPDSPPEPLFVRLYLDRHIMTRLADDQRGHGYDVRTTEEAGMDTASDEDQLAFATADRRAILTYNIRDFAPLHEQWLAAGRPHAGRRNTPTPNRCCWPATRG
jgi:predicted nuclease of predicted toxin-antitoxin system